MKYFMCSNHFLIPQALQKKQNKKSNKSKKQSKKSIKYKKQNTKSIKSKK